MQRKTLSVLVMAAMIGLSGCSKEEVPAPQDEIITPEQSASAESKEQAPSTLPASAETFSVVEASFSDMQAAMDEGRTTSEAIVQQYLTRIEQYNPLLGAAITIADDALAQARKLDQERANGNVRGPLHGIPIALKDNIHTTDMPTTGGALAFEDFTPPYEATLVDNLREAGAIIIAKTTLTELANWVATGMPNNYNAVNGYGYNPYDPRMDPREGFNDGRGVLDTGGSSSGIGTAANLWAANVGTETSGSLEIPSNNTRLVGIKPTVGRVSRYGIIPITADQDTAGAMAKTVADAATLLAAMESDDSNDPDTGVCPPPGDDGYSEHFLKDGLQGVRIGIPRAFYYEAFTPPGENKPRGGLTEAQAEVMKNAIAALKVAGATVVDPANIPSVTSGDPDANQLLFGNCYDTPQGKGGDTNCSVVMKYGMKRDFNKWLDSLGDSAPVESLTALREFNEAHREENAIKYDQAELDISDQMDVYDDRERYNADREKDILLTRTLGIDAAMKEHQLDALMFPAWYGENIINKAGYPVIAVPFSEVPNTLDPPLPEGFDPKPIPFGVTFVGTACSEGKLIEMAYGFEQATLGRKPPEVAP
ncbi:amidase family protein [Pseudomaricurvus sp.]|uniref:amidase family protein n=1 Tax=Pseudomaricurvus sp. TaxID=2004510 RepID=UPI003F6B41BF